MNTNTILQMEQKNDALDMVLFKRILFIVQDPSLEEEVRDTLDLHFFDVTVARNGAEAVRALVKGQYDLILCDITIPNLPADMFFKALERVRPELCQRFISITSADYRSKAGNPGVISVWKPIDNHILLEAIESVLKKSSVPSANSQQRRAA